MTMPTPRPEDVEQLLDAHLDRLDEVEQAALRQRLQNEPALQACSDRLGAMLEPLDTWSVPPPPSGLIQGVLARLPISRAIQPRPGSAPMGLEPIRMRRPFVTLREVLAVAACIVLFAGVVVPGFKKIRNGAHQAGCAANLQTIYAATTAYANTFGGQLPYAGTVSNTFLTSNGRRGLQPDFAGGQLSNTGNQFLLFRLRLVQNPAVFICPARPDDRAMDAGTVQSLVAFPFPANNSYDSQWREGPLALAGGDPRRPLQSDANPFFDKPDLSVTVSSTANSLSHGQRGQNVLNFGGAVPFETTPVINGNDNIWQIGDVETTGFLDDTGPPTHDAFLVPESPRSTK